MDISKLLADLSSNGVESFDGYGIKVKFYPKQQSSSVSVPLVSFSDSSTKEGPVSLKEGVGAPQSLNPDPALAQSLDAEMNYDKVLNWSASPDVNEKETPLTGDNAPLTNEV